MNTGDIQIRDPFVFPNQDDSSYYLFGTTDKDCWRGPGQGFDCYRSRDLKEWEGPIPAFRPSDDFWGKENFWAPEVHRLGGRFYMFASFIAPQRYRGTQILVAKNVWGPYEPLADGPVTPADWQCLDGTLHVDDDGNPWIVFCHEWVQTHNGSIWAMPLAPDLAQAAGRPVFLFNASEAPWVRRSAWPEKDARFRFPTYVTDGPFLRWLSDGTLIMLWSSFGSKGYAMGVSRSQTGQIAGPWQHDPDPLWAEDGGHGMIFTTFGGQLMLTFHSPNDTPNERPVFVEVEEKGGRIHRVA
ncbi:MAG: family 43 glycosylhydrolase [Caldilineae bacterium]|nr:family 43 glycosylhydrolase [Anaerolineae bacterium]MCB0253597.1 family 43 glycosylhydrolase [Anaerolineae bacterium]MCB9153634.1 family 43 glycosylhydrolase [Caldilineae bacterium]